MCAYLKGVKIIISWDKTYLAWSNTKLRFEYAPRSWGGGGGGGRCGGVLSKYLGSVLKPLPYTYDQLDFAALFETSQQKTPLYRRLAIFHAETYNYVVVQHTKLISYKVNFYYRTPGKEPCSTDVLGKLYPSQNCLISIPYPILPTTHIPGAYPYSSGTYSLYMGVTPPPPLPAPTGVYDHVRCLRI